jgi:hypothetical protein
MVILVLLVNMVCLKGKVFENKSNNQISIVLSKKEIEHNNLSLFFRNKNVVSVSFLKQKKKGDD